MSEQRKFFPVKINFRPVNLTDDDVIKIQKFLEKHAEWGFLAKEANPGSTGFHLHGGCYLPIKVGKVSQYLHTALGFETDTADLRTKKRKKRHCDGSVTIPPQGKGLARGALVCGTWYKGDFNHISWESYGKKEGQIMWTKGEVNKDLLHEDVQANWWDTWAVAMQEHDACQWPVKTMRDVMKNYDEISCDLLIMPELNKYKKQEMWLFFYKMQTGDRRQFNAAGFRMLEKQALEHAKEKQGAELREWTRRMKIKVGAKF